MSRRPDSILDLFCARSGKQNVIYFDSHHFIKLNMSSHPFRCVFVLSLLVLSGTCVLAEDQPLFHSTDPLAPRDEWGVLHQTATVNPIDYVHRESCRLYYYFKSGRELLADPAYVGALQVVLRSRGYYCGPIDGIMSEEVSDAIARVQKNYAQRVTGRLTVPVRRALNLP